MQSEKRCKFLCIFYSTFFTANKLGRFPLVHQIFFFSLRANLFLKWKFVFQCVFWLKLVINFNSMWFLLLKCSFHFSRKNSCRFVKLYLFVSWRITFKRTRINDHYFIKQQICNFLNELLYPTRNISAHCYKKENYICQRSVSVVVLFTIYF